MLKTNDRVKVRIYGVNGEEILTRNFNAVFLVQEEDGKLGIDWNTDRNPLTCNGNVFTPFEAFSCSVIFENVENEKKYCWSNSFNGLVAAEFAKER